MAWNALVAMTGKGKELAKPDFSMVINSLRWVIRMLCNYSARDET